MSNKKGNKQNRVFWEKKKTIVVFVKRTKQKKKAKEAIQDQEKKKNKNSEKWKKRENMARQEREQVDRGWTKGGKKRQSRHSKREDVESVEVNVKSSKTAKKTGEYTKRRKNWEKGRTCKNMQICEDVQQEEKKRQQMNKSMNKRRT